jgi:hypothetical protein
MTGFETWSPKAIEQLYTIVRRWHLSTETTEGIAEEARVQAERDQPHGDQTVQPVHVVGAFEVYTGAQYVAARGEAGPGGAA